MAFSYLLKRALFEYWTGVKIYIFAAFCVFKEIFIRITRKHIFKGEVLKRNDAVAVITGGLSGIGLETTRRLLSSGMHVIVGVNIPKEERIAFQTKLQNDHPSSKVEVWYLDLACMPSVKRFAERFARSSLTLNLLVNNAGIMFMPYEETEDGFEYHFSVNFLGHALLTLLLIPYMDKSGKYCSRIVNVSSSVHQLGVISFDDLQSQRLFSRYFAYIQSKLCVVMFTFALQRQLQKHIPNITANCLHPGVANTSLYQHVEWAVNYPFLTRLFLMTPAEGCQTTVYAALSPDLEGIGGKYLQYCAISKSSKYAQNEEFHDKLWKSTLELLKPWLGKERFGFLGRCEGDF